ETMASLAADGLHQSLSLGRQILIPFSITGRHGMLLEPFFALLLGERPQEGGDRQGLIFFEIKIRHACPGTELVRIFDPTDHPVGVHFCADPFEAWADLGNVFVSLDQMATRTADLLEGYLTLSEQRGILETLGIEMAGDATRLNLRAAQQRMIPIG